MSQCLHLPRLEKSPFRQLSASHHPACPHTYPSSTAERRAAFYFPNKLQPRLSSSAERRASLRLLQITPTTNTTHEEMASDQDPLLRPSPADGETGGSGDGGDTSEANNNSRKSDDRAQQAQQDGGDDEEQWHDHQQQQQHDGVEEARDRDHPQRLSPSSSPSPSAAAAAGGGRSAACRGRKTAAFAVAAGVCVLVFGVGFGAGARFGDSRRRRREHPSAEEAGRGGGGDTAAVGLGDRLSLPQCYSSSAADPSIGAWRRCDGGAGECSPMGNPTLPDWMPEMESRCSARWASEHKGNEVMPYWTWETSNCRLEEVDADKFCRVMEGRKGLLFVGDSLTGQTVDALALLLRAELTDFKSLYYDKFTACGGALRFSWYRNDYLDTRTTASGGFETVHCEVHDVSMSRCMVFADDSVLGEYDTLVVNAGAHRRTGGIEAYGEMMANSSAILTASMKRLHGDGAILVVRNTVPGHGDPKSDNWGDRTFAGPVDIDTANSIVAEGKPIWGWAIFPDKNKLLEEAFGAPTWALLDAYTPTVLRPDMHADGLHYCFPGPLDHWITLLYNLLLVETAARA